MINLLHILASGWCMCRLKRAGLDYWPFVVVKVHDDWAAFQEFFQKQGRGRLIAFSKFGKQSHVAADTYHPGAGIFT